MDASALIRRLCGARPWRRVAFALVMGVAGAGLSIAMVLACNWANSLWQHNRAWLVALPLLGVASIALYRRLGLKDHVDAGDVIRDIRDDQAPDPWLAPAALLGTCASLAGGASVGKTATAMEIGATMGALLIKPFGIRLPDPADPSQLHPAYGYGAEVGLTALVAALFTAPLSAVAFVLELLRLNATRPRHTPTLLVTAVVAAWLARQARVSIVVPMTPLLTLSWETAAHAALVGTACAVGGALYTWSVSTARELVRSKLRRPLVGAAIGGALVCALVLGLGWDAYAGTGEELLGAAFNGTAAPGAWLFKALLTVLSLGFGLVGGEITPLLIVGALLGGALAQLVGAYVPLMAGLGMLAFLAAGARCPWAAIFMGCELFGWQGFWFYAIAVTVAYAGSRDVGLYGEDMAGRTRLFGERAALTLYRAGLGRPLLLACQLLGRKAPAILTGAAVPGGGAVAQAGVVPQVGAMTQAADVPKVGAVPQAGTMAQVPAPESVGMPQAGALGRAPASQPGAGSEPALAPPSGAASEPPPVPRPDAPKPSEDFLVPAERIASALEESPELAQGILEAVAAEPGARDALGLLVREDPSLRAALERSLDLHPQIAALLYRSLGADAGLDGLAQKAWRASLVDHVRRDPGAKG